MSGTYSAYAGAPGTGDTGPLPSGALWHQVDAELNRPGLWMHQFEDFTDDVYTETLPTADDPWHGLRVFTSSGATLNAVDAEGGVRELVEATDNEGLSISRGIYSFKIIQGAGPLVFEARVKRTNITATFGFFLGLIENVAPTAILPIAADGTLSDNNLVGFYQPEGDPDGVDTAYKANAVTAVTVKADAVTLVADTYVKLGMLYNRAGDFALEFTKDGVILPDRKIIPTAAGTDFPNDVRLGWIFAVLNGATAALNASIDWVRVAQRRVSAP